MRPDVPTPGESEPRGRESGHGNEGPRAGGETGCPGRLPGAAAGRGGGDLMAQTFATNRASQPGRGWKGALEGSFGPPSHTRERICDVSLPAGAPSEQRAGGAERAAARRHRASEDYLENTTPQARACTNRSAQQTQPRPSARRRPVCEATHASGLATAPPGTAPPHNAPPHNAPAHTPPAPATEPHRHRTTPKTHEGPAVRRALARHSPVRTITSFRSCRAYRRRPERHRPSQAPRRRSPRW